MNANSLKSMYEKLPRGVKFIFAPVFVRKMVDNATFKKTWKEIDAYEAMTSEEKKAYQFKKLQETLIYAYDNVSFYRERFEQANFNPKEMRTLNDIVKVPILEKSEAINAGNAFYSTEENLDYYETFTGGSSGQTLRVLLDKNSIYSERAYVCHFLSKFGYDIHKTKTVALWGHNKDCDYYYSPLKNEIVISPFRFFKAEQLDSVCKDIQKFGAEFLAGYPSAIYTLAQMVKNKEKKMHFKHVIFYAENYSQEEKDFIEEVFGCKADSYYGHTERAVFAHIIDDECIFQETYGYTELIPTETPNEYRIVCTGFLSKKMPLIRYATDDVVTISPDGKKQLVGHKRSNVYLLAKNGARIFKGAMTLHVSELDSIVRYQYVQNVIGKADLNLMTSRPLTSQEIQMLRDYLDRRVEGLLDIEIHQVDNIKLTARGKERWAICNVGTNSITSVN